MNGTEEHDEQSRREAHRQGLEAVLGPEALAQLDEETERSVRRIEGPPPDELVTFDGGWTARRRFTGDLLVGLEDHTPARAAAVVVIGDDKKPRAMYVTIHPIIDEPLTNEQLIQAVSGLLDRLVAFELQVTTKDRGYDLADLEGVTDMATLDKITGQDHAEALAQAKRMRRRRQTTPERLAEVAALYAKGGIRAVADTLHLSESQSYKLLAKSRKQESEAS